MTVLFRVWAALALLTLNAITVMADGSCVPTCVNTVQNNHFREFGCGAANEVGCLCDKQDFVDLVAECSQTCGATVDEIRQGLVGPERFCNALPALVPAARVSASPTSPVATTSAPEASTPPPTTSSTASQTPSPTSTSPSSTSTTSSTSSTLATSTTLSAPSTTNKPTSNASTSSRSSTSSTSSTSKTAAGETSPASSPVPATGISSGAAAGIGIGVAIVAVAVGVIAFCLLRNRRKQAAPRQSMEISKPLPGSGRTYPMRDDRERSQDPYDKYNHDIEMTSNRYEDMVPSQQPRTMV